MIRLQNVFLGNIKQWSQLYRQSPFYLQKILYQFYLSGYKKFQPSIFICIYICLYIQPNCNLFLEETTLFYRILKSPINKLYIIKAQIEKYLMIRVLGNVIYQRF